MRRAFAGPLAVAGEIFTLLALNPHRASRTTTDGPPVREASIGRET